MSVNWFGRPWLCKLMLRASAKPKRTQAAAAIEGIVAPEHDRHHRDPAAPGAHVLGEDADGAERELRAGKAGQRARDQHGDDCDSARTSTPSVSAASGCSPTPRSLQAERRLEQDDAHQRRQCPGGPGEMPSGGRSPSRGSARPAARGSRAARGRRCQDR